MFTFLLKTAIFAHIKDYLRTRIFQRITQAQPQVCYSKQLVLGVEIVVEDFNFESQVLLMRTNLDLTHIEKRFRGIFNMTRWLLNLILIHADRSIVPTSLSLMRKSAQSGFKLFFLVSDLLSTWDWCYWRKFKILIFPKPGNFLLLMVSRWGCRGQICLTSHDPWDARFNIGINICPIIFP